MPHADPIKRSQYQKEYYKKNKKKLLEYRTDWAKNNLESRRESANKYARSDRNRQRFSKMKSRYGLSEEYFWKLIEEQDNSCAGCLEKFGERFPDVDHCHTTGVVRGLLCNNCNRGLGHLKENPDTMLRLIKYLRCT